MTSAGGLPFSDVTGRMAVFGRLFGEQVGVSEPTVLDTPEELVTLVRERVPRQGSPLEEVPIFEAAAYVGEWLRGKVQATWVAEGPYEPHLQVVDDSHAIVYLVPLVTLLRTASTAGYDGLSELLSQIVKDTDRHAHRIPLPSIPVEPRSEREDVVAWIRANRDVRNGLRASLWRRCSACATLSAETVTLHRAAASDWETESATAAAILAQRPFRCACGGQPGQGTRFLMMREEEGELLFGDIHVTGSYTRVGCWEVDDEDIEPFDALALASDGAVGA